MIDDGETLALPVILDKYVSLLQKQGIENSKYRLEKLKRRLVIRFPTEIGFWYPQGRYKTGYVYSEIKPKGFYAHAVKGEGVLDSESEIEDDAILEQSDLQPASTSDYDFIHEVYHTAKLIRGEILSLSPLISWPTDSSELTVENIAVPDIVYNMIAWILTDDSSNSEPITMERVKVSETVECKILSFGQDLLSAASNNKKKTPKHVAPPMTVKNLTGSAEVVHLLNQFGHGISYTQLEELETAIAEKVVVAEQNGVFVPSNCQIGMPAVFCWDTNDTAEETLSGKIQHTARMESSYSSLLQHVLKSQMNQRYKVYKRSGPCPQEHL